MIVLLIGIYKTFTQLKAALKSSMYLFITETFKQLKGCTKNRLCLFIAETFKQLNSCILKIESIYSWD